MQGTIKKITDRGFGFIIRDDNQEEVFFHSSECELPFESFQEGDKVSFEIKESPKGLNAVQVNKI